MKEPRILQFKHLRDGSTDQRTDTASYRDARTHLKIIEVVCKPTPEKKHQLRNIVSPKQIEPLS